MAESRKALVAKFEEGLAKAAPSVPVVALPEGTAPDIVVSFMPEVMRALQHEYEAIDRVPDAMHEADGFGSLGDTPLVVIRRGNAASPPSEEDRQWQAMQEALAGLSSRSELVVATGAGHVIPYEAPQVVADAVRRILAMAAANP